MPTGNKPKKLIRARMTQTGEPYAEARTNILAQEATVTAKEEWNEELHSKIHEVRARHRHQLNSHHDDIFSSDVNIWKIVVPDQNEDGLEVYVDNVAAWIASHAHKNDISTPSVVHYPSADWKQHYADHASYLIFEDMNSLLKHGDNAGGLLNSLSGSPHSYAFIVVTESENRSTKDRFASQLQKSNAKARELTLFNDAPGVQVPFHCLSL